MEITAEGLQNARCDVVLDGVSGSFDAAWQKIEWDDADEHAACGEGCAHGVSAEHETAHAAPEKAWQAAAWQRYGAGIVVVALGAAWWLSGRNTKASE